MYTILTLLIGCIPDIKPQDAERFEEDPRSDYDRDGFTENEGDCDDTNPDVNPTGIETCDGFDNDCNGIIDDSPIDIVQYYLDSDGDGFGIESTSELSCPEQKSDGYIEAKFRNGEIQFDCDDDNPTVHPDAIEICDFIDNNCNDIQDMDVEVNAPLWYFDSDGDGYGDFENELSGCPDENGDGPSGYVSNYADCNDSNENVYPNAIEYCNEVDDNCNGVVDESSASGASIWYRDEDLDGFGFAGNAIPSCSQPEGFVDNALDCNDSNGDINTNAVEICNNEDDDCDGFIDEGADSNAPMGSVTYYRDFDQDGFGDANNAITQCNMPTAFVTNDLDCNDGDSDVYPNAIEYCNEMDDNCDGTVDEQTAFDLTTYYLDQDGDGFGDSLNIQYACPSNQPNETVLVAGDCAPTDPSIYPGAAEVCNGLDDDCNGSADEGIGINAPANSDTWFYDLDGDGYGNPNNTIQACVSPIGTVDNSDDCNDANPSIYTGANEYCNGIDDDCDGVLDNNALDFTNYFQDNDGDGHGDASTIVSICATITNGEIDLPSGTSLLGDDCDDNNPNISPSANEQCTDTIDENCDGLMTYGVLPEDLPSWYPDSDGDGYGNPNFVIQLCQEPQNYVSNPNDCNDTDYFVHPLDQTVHANEYESDGVTLFVHRERCNGKVDLCENNFQGDLTPLDDEIDDDGDGYVDCLLDVNPLQWADPSTTILGGEDCDDNNPFSFPYAPELCNGTFEDCKDPLYITQSQTAPDDEIDDDGDCFVECNGFDSTIWEGGIHTCQHIDSNGNTIAETVVIGGEDCNDENANTYVGAAINEPLICAQDSDFDGNPDCNLVGNLPWNSSYSCDLGVFLPNGEMGPDFMLIQAGSDPLGRYDISNDFYVMTTEVTQGMWNAVMSNTNHAHIPNWTANFGNGDLYPAYFITWFDAIAFANQLSLLTGKELCYADLDDPNVDPNQEYAPDELNTTFTTPYECSGFRLLTEAEWEYASRSESSGPFWTPSGGGDYNADGCLGSEFVQDANNTPIISLGWYCGNNDNQHGNFGSKEVAQKIPNDYGLYDMHGNVNEWTYDWHAGIYPNGSIDPFNSTPSLFRSVRGGSWSQSALLLKNTVRYNRTPTDESFVTGFRITITR